MLAGRVLLGQDHHQEWTLRQHACILVQLLGLQHRHRSGGLVPPDACAVETETSSEAENQFDCSFRSWWIVRSDTPDALLACNVPLADLES